MEDHQEAKAEAEAEYESDPEDAPLPSMRRREASDDEDGEGFHGGRNLKKDLRSTVGSDGEFDDQGGAEVYEDEEEDEEYYDEDDDLEEEEEELKERFGGRLVGSEERELITKDDGALRKPESPRNVQDLQDSMGDSQGSVGDAVEKNAADGEEKKENEPFAVPTSGAFYMHDDRFQENGRGRHRRMSAGRKLWDHKDERAWVHDRFEEMNLQNAHDHGERRQPGGQFRGRGSGRVRGGYNRGGRSRKYHVDDNNSKQAPRTVKGRGPRHYDYLIKSNKEIPYSERKVSSAKPEEATSNASSGRQASQTAKTQPDLALPQKHFASSLNYASPPFYPSGSSNQEIFMQKRGTQTGDANKSSSSSVQVEVDVFASETSLLRGKSGTDKVNQNSLYIDDNFRSVTDKGLAGSYSPSVFLANDVPLSQVIRGSGHGQMAVTQQRLLKTQNQPELLSSMRQLVQVTCNGNQSSPPQPTDSSEIGLAVSPPSSNRSKTLLDAKGKTNNLGSGRGPYLYTEAHGDQNFPGTPALLPVMQFAGQHPGGLGVPSVGMALPGYVAQPQLGFGNSEMTWVPVLAGAAGALGASYCSQYIALDGSYYAHPSEHTSSLASSRETNTTKAAISLNSLQRPEVINDELAQRQNKPRRYSEMNFGQ